MFASFEDTIIKCPVNKFHKVSKSKMRKHLEKCLKANKLINKTICAYNPLHIIDTDEREKHLLECEDNPKIYISWIDSSIKPNYSGVISVNEAVEEVDKVLAAFGETKQKKTEFIECSAYDPVKANINRALYRPPLIGGTKSEKKAFRKKEVQRHKVIQLGRLNEQICGDSGADIDGKLLSILLQDVTGISWDDINSRNSLKRNFIDAASDLFKKYDLFVDD
ncbi:uncharacterized protein LOC141533723 [Cotesia typhae]|uniref:uncharacterized protein LOC141533723 n=1 Tax=Cotesia typhae TaxID=2053667 RepID=UPI003D698742